MVNILTVDIGGQVFNTFKSVNIDTDLYKFGFAFDIVINVPIETPITTLGNEIKIKIDGETILTGFIEKQDISYSADNANLSIFGRDKLCDFSDSRISNKIFKTPIGFLEILGKLLAQTGFEVVSRNKIIGLKTDLSQSQVSIINDAGDIEEFQTNEGIGFGKDESAYSLIQRLANKRKLVIGTDGDGNFIIRKIGKERAKTILVNDTFANKPNLNNNIKDAKIIRDDSQRYYEYKILSSGTNTAPTQAGTMNGETALPPIDSLNDNTAQYSGVFYDKSIRKTRKFLDNVTGMNNALCKERAEWECNIRLAKSFQYRCFVYGWRQNLNPIISQNPLWKINELVKVVDSRAGIDDDMLIKSINYTQDTSSGTRAEMTLVNKLAYTDSVFEPKIKRGKKKESSTITLDPTK
jgi:prophage tail gpP-like protein